MTKERAPYNRTLQMNDEKIIEFKNTQDYYFDIEAVKVRKKVIAKLILASCPPEGIVLEISKQVNLKSRSANPECEANPCSKNIK